MNNPIITCSNLVKTYEEMSSAIHVLQGISLTIHSGSTLAIVGPSGSGKSTLLHLLGGLDVPSAGKVNIDGIDWQSLSERERCHLRNKHLGFVYQFHHLLPEFTALENTAMPLLLASKSIKEAQEEAKMMLNRVGLSARLQHKLSQLSGGERQRVAIARALVHKPSCVFADEPTGNLDSVTAGHIFDLMLDLNAELNTALVIVTHDQQLAHRLDQKMSLKEGMLVDAAILT